MSPRSTPTGQRGVDGLRRSTTVYAIRASTTLPKKSVDFAFFLNVLLVFSRFCVESRRWVGDGFRRVGRIFVGRGWILGRRVPSDAFFQEFCICMLILIAKMELCITLRVLTVSSRVFSDRSLRRLRLRLPAFQSMEPLQI